MSQSKGFNGKISKVAMSRIRNGIIREQKQTNTWNVHTGEEEANEERMFRRFLKCRTGCMVYATKGNC